jgi:hypothetical protein
MGYQRHAIKAVGVRLSAGDEHLLLAMANRLSTGAR